VFSLIRRISGNQKRKSRRPPPRAFAGTAKKIGAKIVPPSVAAAYSRGRHPHSHVLKKSKTPQYVSITFGDAIA